MMGLEVSGEEHAEGFLGFYFFFDIKYDSSHSVCKAKVYCRIIAANAFFCKFSSKNCLVKRLFYGELMLQLHFSVIDCASQHHLFP